MMLPASERLLLGPGPSLVPPRVMRAMAAPVLGHLDPQLLAIMDAIRLSLGRLFNAPDGSIALAVPGTGTAAMEAAIANLVAPNTRVLVAVNGYFGMRIAEIATRYGASVRQVSAEWGRAVSPSSVGDALAAEPADIVALVHAETSTGVLNPVPEIARVAREAGALVLVDTVTSLGGMPVDVAGWGVDACYSASQKCLGAPSGLAPLVFTPSALERRVPCRSFYLDLDLLDQYWSGRRYHHTIAATLVYALAEALAIVEEESLPARWQRHRAHHDALVAGLGALNLPLLAPPDERLWTLHVVLTPDGLDEAALRRDLREQFDIEIGAGIGPLASRAWRIGLMGASSSRHAVLLLLAALEHLLPRHGFPVRPGAATAAALGSLGA